MRSTNSRFRRWIVVLLFVAECLIAINLFYTLRSFGARSGSLATAPHEESALQNALIVARVQTAIALTNNTDQSANTVITGTIPNPPTAAPLPTLTSSLTLAEPTTTASPTAIQPTATATNSPTPLPTDTATATLSPAPLPPFTPSATATRPPMPTATTTVLPPTPVPSTATALPTVVPSPTVAPVATNTAVPTATATHTPLPTPTTTATAEPSPTATIYYVTPSPSAPDLFSAATLVAQQTVNASTTGTATPLPPNMRVYTIRIVPYEPLPANEATATMQAIEATARAVTTGEPPTNVLVWTATPLPTNTTGPTNTPSVTPPPTATPTVTLTPFVVTATYTPENVMAAATLVASITVQAKTIGTITPLPANAVLATATPRPIVVTSTPTAANGATATAMIAEETAIAFTTGTPDYSRFVTATPTPYRGPVERPAHTPTPLLIALDDLTATPTPDATEVFPIALIGKILFLGDFDGRGGPEVYAVDPDGSNVMRVSGRELYLRAVDRDSYSADRRFRAFVKREEAGTQERQIYAYDSFYNSERQLTNMKDGSTSWDPVWSPIDEVIAFVTNQTDSDEIWLVERESRAVTQLTFNDGPWDKHPSWSPDGTQIVFVSSRSGQREIWIMARDGMNQRQLVLLDFEAWDPVWVKYGDQ